MYKPEEKEKKKVKKEKALNTWNGVKIILAKEFIDDEVNQINRKPVKGSVHLCQLGENIGSEQGEERPVVIVSNNRINSTSPNVIIVPLSKALKKKTIINRKKRKIEVPRVGTHYFLKKNKYTFLDYDSAAMAEGLKTVSKIRLGKHLGKIDDKDLQAISSRIKWIFDL